MSYGHANGLAKNCNPTDAWPWGIGVLVRAKEGRGDEWARGVGEIVGPGKDWLQHHPQPEEVFVNFSMGRMLQFPIAWLELWSVDAEKSKT